MAYTSRAWISGWSYDKNGTDFNATVGRILSHGVDYDTSVETIRATRMANKLATQQLAQQQAAVYHQKQQQQKEWEQLQQQAASGDGGIASTRPRPGYAWVDDKGGVVDATLAIDPAAAFKGQGTSHPASTSPWAGLPQAERSMAIWKKISPGMLPGSSQTPISMMKSAFVWEGELTEPKDLTHHLKKTDFSAYTEVALRHMHHIKAAAKK